MEAELVSRAMAVATSLADALDLLVSDAVVIHNSNKLALRLLPCDVFARVALVGQEVAALEVELAQRLAAVASPVAALEPPAKADWAKLFALKQRWHVSIAALLMRAKDLEIMTPAAYTTAMKGISARGWRRSEPIPLGEPEKSIVTTELLKVAQSRIDWFPHHLLPALAESIKG